MKTVERVNFKIFPNEEQKAIIIANCHNARFAYNWGVAIIRECLAKGERYPSAYNLCKEFTRFKHQPGYEWLCKKPASQRATKNAIVKSLQNSMRHFGKGHNKPPIFHSRKKAEMSYYTHEGTTLYEQKQVRIENLGWVKCRNNLPLDDPNVKIAEPLVRYTGDDFELSVVLKYKTPVKPKYHYSDVDVHHRVIGIDIGVRHMAVTSDGDVYDMPKLTKIDRKINRIDRRLSKLYLSYRSYCDSVQACDTKTKYPETRPKSQNLLKLESKRRKYYRKHANIRRNIRCKAVADIVHKYPAAIVIEGIKNPREKWKIKGAHKFNKRLNDLALTDFLNRLEYKCKWLDIPLIKADLSFPSTQMCSCCGNLIDNQLTKDRMFICSVCGHTEDRDVNAACNLRNLGESSMVTYQDSIEKLA